MGRKKQSKGIFISYRRSDSKNIAGRIFDKLEQRFGKKMVFRDKVMPLGRDFQEVIKEQLESCHVAIIIIGPEWLNTTDENGVPRLHNEDDWVRIEVAAVLSRDPPIPCLPILVDGAVLPEHDELPECLGPLSYRQSFEVRDDPHFKRDVAHIIEELNPRPEWGKLAVISALILMCTITIASLLGFFDSSDSNALIQEERSPSPPVLEQPFENSLRMKFVPIEGLNILFSVWETRVRDYQAYAKENEIKPVTPDFGEPYRQSGNEPIVEVDLNDAIAFCNWLTEKERSEGWLKKDQKYRLPTDSEWSIAVGLKEEPEGSPKFKGENPKTEVYAWNGGKWPPDNRAGNYGGLESVTPLAPKSLNDEFKDDHKFTSVVGAYSANELGICDLGGNVWEWCNSLFESDSEMRVLRGGSWNNVTKERMLSTFRNIDPPEAKYNNVGFRCVVELPRD